MGEAGARADSLEDFVTGGVEGLDVLAGTGLKHAEARAIQQMPGMVAQPGDRLGIDEGQAEKQVADQGS